MLTKIQFKKLVWSVTGFFVGVLLSACSSPPPVSPEYQRRLKAAQEAKEIQDHNNQVREYNQQVQEQNRLEERELARLRAERAEQRNAAQAARQEANEQNQ